MGPDPSFRCAGPGGDSEGEGRKRSVFDVRRGGTSDEERREVPACSGWFCHVAYCMRTCKTGIEKDTDLYWVLIFDLHASRRRGRSDSIARRMYACTHTGKCWLGHTSIGPWSRSRSGPTVHISMSLPDLLGFRLHDPTRRGYPCPRC